VIDGSRAFVKLIGLPYALPVREGRWVYYAEIENPPMLTLLEQILWRLKPYMKVAFPAFADDDSIPNLRPLVGADSSTSGVRISPMEGQIPGQAFSFAALEEGIEISEEEYRLLYPFISFLSLSMTDENWIEMSGLSQGEHRDAVRRLSELRVLFTCGDDVFVNLDAMRLCVAGRSGFLVGEDSRGRLGRSTLRSRSHDAPSGTRVLHVALDNPWDNNVVGLVGFEVPTGEERLIDHVRYTHLEAATERLRRQDSSGGSVTEDQMQLRGSEAEGVDQE